MSSSLSTGLAACGLAIVFFGSFFVPVKSFNPGDGFFAQWMMSIGVIIVGFIVQVWQQFPPMQPIAALGGVLWAIGNATALPIMSRLGMAMSVLVWNSSMVVVGWASGRFGWFQTKPQPALNEPLNYIGLTLVVIGGVIFSLLRPSKTQKGAEDEAKAAVEPEEMPLNELPGTEKLQIDSQVSSTEKGIALMVALLAGVCYGLTFTPVFHILDNRDDRFPDASPQILAYVFSHYVGIFLTSTAIFLVYAIVKCNRPWVSGGLALPAIVSGSMWAIAQTAFFVANQHLSQTITFPIVGMAPGCLAAIWSIFYFRDIQGARNFRILGIAFTVTILGTVCTALSKTWSWS